jgi:hypothetical protein
MKKKLAGWMGMFGALVAVQGTAQAQDWGDIEKLQDFVTRRDVVVNVDQIDNRGLMQAELPNRPWSSTYWPDNTGSVAWPYGPHNLLIASSWKINRPYVANREGLHRNVLSLSQQEIDDMSPAEKYDVLMGDANFTFTNQVVARIDQLGTVNLLSTWSGVCHGWSPASLTLDRPQHGVTMYSPLGRQVTFYPADIKALASFLWGTSFSSGEAQDYVKVEGWECQTGGKTNRHGRLVDPRCFDPNPGFFHLVMINQIGINQRGFVMDRSNRAEVQNQPTYKYEAKYYNVADKHGSAGVSLGDAKIFYSANLDDPYRNYRSKKTVYLLGVEATLWYGMENTPDHSWTDGPENDKTGSLTIRYDLELDASDNVVGGEWREYKDAPTLFEQVAYKHPDIMWLVPPKVSVWTPGDLEIRSPWNGNGAPPADWQRAAKTSDMRKYGDHVRGHDFTRLAPQPLAKVIDVLISKARQ